MKMGKKLIAIFMAATMTLSLAACSSDNSSSSADGSSSDASNSGSTGEITNIKWVAVGTGMPNNYSDWQANMNEYLGEKIGVNIDMEIVGWGDWDTRRSVIVTTGGDYDILFTNGDNYTNDVNTGAFLDIADMLDTTTPELKDMIPEDYWDACRINDKIYAVPTYKDSSISNYFVWDAELANSLDIDMESIKVLEDLTPALEAIKESTGKPSFMQSKGTTSWLSFEYDTMSTGLGALGVRHDDADAQVVSIFETEELAGKLATMREWYQAGIINADAATKPEGDTYLPVKIAQGWSGAAKTSWGPGMGVEAEAYKYGPTIISNETVQGSLNCISASSKNPEKALEFLQLINTDSYVRDSFYYGLEGDDWDYTDDGLVHKNNEDWTMAGYTQGQFFNVTQRDDVDFNQWDEVQELNENATPSVLLGFTFDVSSVADQLNNCISIFERYKNEIGTGTVDPTTSVAAMMDEMRAAGFDEIQAEAQAQVDAFMGK